MESTRTKIRTRSRKIAAIKPKARIEDSVALSRDRRYCAQSAPAADVRSSALQPIPAPGVPSQDEHFQILTDADFYGPFQPADAILCRFSRDYSDSVSVVVKTPIGAGRSYHPDELNSLATKLLHIAEDAVERPGFAREPATVRLY